MSWILGAVYCGFIWLVFAKLRLLKLTLPIAVLAGSIGPTLIVALLFCAQYFHPYTTSAIAIEKIDPISVQLTQPGRVTEVLVEPNVPIRKGDVLIRVDAEPWKLAVEQAEVGVEQAKQNVTLAQSSVAVAEANLRRATSDLQYAENDRDRLQKLRASNAASQNDLELAQTRYEQANSARAQAEERLSQARINIEVSSSQVEQSENALNVAKYNLEQCTVVAPGDGFVTNLQVRKGLLVSASMGPIMTFVHENAEADQGVIVATFMEKNFLRIKSGQYAEVAMYGYPGQILTGRVLNTIDVSGAGQLDATGRLPTGLVSVTPTQFAVRIKLDQADLRIPGGARGQAAVYTENVQIAGIPVMFLIRAKSWLSYIL